MLTDCPSCAAPRTLPTHSMHSVWHRGIYRVGVSLSGGGLLHFIHVFFDQGMLNNCCDRHCTGNEDKALRQARSLPAWAHIPLEEAGKVAEAICISAHSHSWRLGLTHYLGWSGQGPSGYTQLSYYSFQETFPNARALLPAVPMTWDLVLTGLRQSGWTLALWTYG